MIERNGKEYKTEAQWNKEKRAILKRQQDKGIQETWYIDRKHTRSAVFYSIEQTRPFNKKELAKAKREQAILRKTRRERLSCRCCGTYYGRHARWELDSSNLCKEFCSKPHTAWQWLANANCIPVKGAEPYYDTPEYWDGEEYVQADRGWYYYTADQVKPVDTKKYERLKALYVKKFGGWEYIDLRNTDYNGKVWW